MQQGDNHPLDDHTEITVETLRTPPVRIERAPLRRRLLACLIDSTIIALVWSVALITAHLEEPQAMFGAAVYLTIVAFAYYFLQEAVFASTIGKRLCSLRIVSKSGDPATLKHSLVRNLLRFVDWLPLCYLLGSVMIATSSNRGRLGDVIAGTIVTVAAEKDINPPPAPFLFH
jgi:uncharacterized RDD family membrane protein YckC